MQVGHNQCHHNLTLIRSAEVQIDWRKVEASSVRLIKLDDIRGGSTSEKIPLSVLILSTYRTILSLLFRI